MKVWDRAEIELASPGSAVRFESVARHVTDCDTRPVIAMSNDMDNAVDGDVANGVDDGVDDDAVV